MFGYTIKPDTLPEWAWRAWRTFIQTLLPSLSVLLGTYAVTQELSLSTVYFSALIPAIAAALAAITNAQKPTVDYAYHSEITD